MKDKLAMLEWTLQALAQPADVQLGHYPDFVCKADELALDFDDAVQCVVSNSTISLSQQQIASLGKLNDKLASLSGEENASLWTTVALQAHAVWAEVRELAKEALALFSWPCVPPPKDPRDRGAHYVKGK